MINWFKNIAFIIYLKFHLTMSYIAMALFNVESDILKQKSDALDSGDEKIERARHRNQTLEKFYAGTRDEKYVQDYYEILKKSDYFLKNSDKGKFELAAHKRGTNYGMKDKYGRRWEHYGFFDEKHKHSGKTLGEVITIELEERRTKDDKYPLKYIFNNIPIDKGLRKTFDLFENKGDKYVEIDYIKKVNSFEYPLSVSRENGDNVQNKIEQLTEYLHVKDLGYQDVQLEFFIPLKFGTDKIENNSEIYLEIINFNIIFAKDDYGNEISFKINNFIKRVIYNETHEVWKFRANEIIQLGQY
jgi:hypothetical protein